MFALRVVAQPLALVLDVWFLPRFESWHSGLLPYLLLASAQLLILAGLLTTAWRVTRSTSRRNYLVGTFLRLVSGVYGLTMLARLLLGATILRDERWFASPVPTTFHLVLAGYLFVYGHYHHSHG